MIPALLPREPPAHDSCTPSTVSPRTALLVTIDEELLGRVEQALGPAGFVVRQVSPAGLFDAARQTPPCAVLVAEDLTPTGGRALVLKARAHPATAGVPVLGLSHDDALAHALGWLRLGATDVWTPTYLTPAAFEALLAEAPLPVHAEVVDRVLAWARRRQLTARYGLFRGTPSEGTVSFVDGALHSATSSWLSGREALAHLVEQQGARLEPLHAPAPPGPEAAAAPWCPRVLLVEDEPSIRLLLRRQLEHQGMHVVEAEDGEAGLQCARTGQFDAIVTDLDLPRLDGWSLLRAVKSDPSMREACVVLLSAHDDAIDALQAARAGARAYLKKTGRAKELLATLALLLAGRRALFEALPHRQPLSLDLLSTGPEWTLRTLAHAGASGLLEVSDELGRYELELAQGHLRAGVAQQGSLRSTGQAALEALLSSRARGHFSFRLPTPGEGRPLNELLDRALEALRAQRVTFATRLLGSPERLQVAWELAGLYTRVASVPALQVLEAFRAGPAPLATLAGRAGLSPLETEAALVDLLARGVLTVA
jgi:two-component system chemotaxis response regulator CheY